MATAILRWYSTQSFPRSACKQVSECVPASFGAGIFFILVLLLKEQCVGNMV